MRLVSHEIQQTIVEHQVRFFNERIIHFISYRVYFTNIWESPNFEWIEFGTSIKAYKINFKYTVEL